MTLPLITIGITCFNAEETISMVIDSALSQDWPNFEIIIVDDYSTDNSFNVIKEKKKGNKSISVIKHKKNLGYPSALNTIIENAKGEYIAFFDDDDFSQTDRLTKQYKRISNFITNKGSKPIICYTNRRVFIDKKEKPDGYVKAIGYDAPEPGGSMVADYLLWHHSPPPYSWGEFGSCTMMASKDILRKYKFDPEFKRCAEWDFAVRVAQDGGYFISVDEPLVLQHKTQTSDKAGKKPLQYGLMLREKHQEYLKKKHTYWGSIILAYSRFYYFRNKFWKSRFFLSIACLLSPTILKSYLSKRNY